ncbi:hypothetical protein An16g03730 [Aspergillus niger]|uniref:Uncharacterized protein n=2 Tax=Aspergillus niger TaxID=5061 RepID=A2R7J3_ASPNC|nr:hypothetical protein An16g03730 [Aspergillus niger]CAK46805.1 hypothetical protein An16g03730 [Aspergillus niger]
MGCWWEQGPVSNRDSSKNGGETKELIARGRQDKTKLKKNSRNGLWKKRLGTAIKLAGKMGRGEMERGLFGRTQTVTGRTVWQEVLRDSKVGFGNDEPKQPRRNTHGLSHRAGDSRHSQWLPALCQPVAAFLPVVTAIRLAFRTIFPGASRRQKFYWMKHVDGPGKLYMVRVDPNPQPTAPARPPPSPFVKSFAPKKISRPAYSYATVLRIRAEQALEWMIPTHYYSCSFCVLVFHPPPTALPALILIQRARTLTSLQEESSQPVIQECDNGLLR